MNDSSAGKPGPAAVRSRVSLAEISELCVTVPDFPQPGVLFRDLTPVFAHGKALGTVIDALLEVFPARGRGAASAETGCDGSASDTAAFDTAGFDAVAGVEARGFILAGAAAYASGTGMLTIRKTGKLPRARYRQRYQLEYGEGALELSAEALPAGSRVLVLDDVLATGGTLVATARLLHQAGLEVAGFGVVLELPELGGRSALAGYPVHSLLSV